MVLAQRIDDSSGGVGADPGHGQKIADAELRELTEAVHMDRQRLRTSSPDAGQGAEDFNRFRWETVLRRTRLATAGTEACSTPTTRLPLRLLRGYVAHDDSGVFQVARHENWDSEANRQGQHRSPVGSRIDLSLYGCRVTFLNQDRSRCERGEPTRLSKQPAVGERGDKIIRCLALDENLLTDRNIAHRKTADGDGIPRRREQIRKPSSRLVGIDDDPQCRNPQIRIFERTCLEYVSISAASVEWVPDSASGLSMRAAWAMRCCSGLR